MAFNLVRTANKKKGVLIYLYTNSLIILRNVTRWFRPKMIFVVFCRWLILHLDLHSFINWPIWGKILTSRYRRRGMRDYDVMASSLWRHTSHDVNSHVAVRVGSTHHTRRLPSLYTTSIDTRKLSNRKDDRAMRNMNVPKIFGSPWLCAYTATFPEIFNGLSFWLTLQNVKFVALLVPEIIGDTQIGAVPGYAKRFSHKTHRKKSSRRSQAFWDRQPRVQLSLLRGAYCVLNFWSANA